MKNLYDPIEVKKFKERIARLRPDTPQQWGKMNAAQALTHLAIGLEIALGDKRAPRKFLFRFLGPIIKRLELRSERPMRRDSPTTEIQTITDQRDLDVERRRLIALIDRFVANPGACTTYPHAFFGRMTPEEWAILMHKHLDHHLRQFGV